MHLARAMYSLPIALAGVGVVAHALGLVGVDPQNAPLLGHAVMLVVDSGVVVGLLKRRAWGYRLALCLFLEQSVLQPYWAYRAAVSEAPLWQAQLATPLACIVCLLVLVFRRDLYVLEDIRPRRLT